MRLPWSMKLCGMMNTKDFGFDLKNLNITTCVLDFTWCKEICCCISNWNINAKSWNIILRILFNIEKTSC